MQATNGSYRWYRRLQSAVAAAVATALAAALVIAPGQVPASAFKPTTHMTAAQLALNSIVVRDGRYYVTILGRDVPLDDEMGRALTTYPEIFLAGATGPDAFPDPLFGQSVIHPSGSDHWSRKVMREARRYGNPGSAARLKAVAFAQGFLSHGAADYWGHAFVNHHAGGVFPELTDVDRIDVAVKHVLLETYIDLFRPRVPQVESAIDTGLDLRPEATLSGDNSGGETAPPYGFLTDVFMDSPAAEAYLPTTPIYRMLKNWECGGGSCEEWFPDSEDVSRWDVAKRWALPTPADQAHARRDLLRRYTQNFGALFINKFVYAKAAPGNAIADRAARQWSELLIGGFCKVALDPEVCSGIRTIGQFVEALSEYLGQKLSWAKRALSYIEHQLNRMIESAADHVLGEVQQMLEKSSVPEEKRRWAIRVLDADGDGRIEWQDITGPKFAHLTKLVVNGEIRCPGDRPCFDTDAVNGALGISNPVLNPGPQTWDPQHFAAMNNAVALTKLNMLDSAGRRDLVAAFASGGKPSFEPSWQWITTFDGHGHGLGRHEFNQANIMAATGWDMFRDPQLRTGLFNRLFLEPIPGFFRNADEEFTGEGVVPRQTLGSFSNGLSQNLCLDVADNSRANGAKIQVWGCNDSTAQQAQLVNRQLRVNGKCVDSPDGSGERGTRLQLWDCHGGAAQQVDYANGQLRLRGMCLDLEGQGRTPGTAVHLWDCDRTYPSQRWTWRAEQTEGMLNSVGEGYACLADIPDPDGSRMRLSAQNCEGLKDSGRLSRFQLRDRRLMIVPTGSGGSVRFSSGAQRSRCLDVKGGGHANGTPVVLWDCNGTRAQMFTLQANGAIEAGVGHGKCLDVSDERGDNGTRLHLWDCHGGANQRFEYHGDKLKTMGKCLDLEGQSTGNGTLVHIWDCGSWNSQKWFALAPERTELCATFTGAGQPLAMDECGSGTQQPIRVGYEAATGGFQIRLAWGGRDFCLRNAAPYAVWSSDCGGNSAATQWRWWAQDPDAVFDPEAECDAVTRRAAWGSVSATTTGAVAHRGGRRCLPRIDVAVKGRTASLQWRKWRGWEYRSRWSRPGSTRFGAWRRHAAAALTRRVEPGSTYRVRIQAVKPGGAKRSHIMRVTFSVD